jgi:hypothetical protein
MDQNLIYVKTAAGENAIAQRTRIIQRNVRMALILVDGQSTVAELIRKIGNLQLTENALAELEKGGFIELKRDSQHLEDSLWEKGDQVAREVRSSAAKRQSGQSEQPAEEIRVNYRNTGQAGNSRIRGGANRAITLPPFDAEDPLDFSASRFSSLPSSMESPAPQTGRPSPVARLKSVLPVGSGARRTAADEPVKLKPIQRGKKKNWLGRVFFCLAVALAGGIAWALLFPLDFLAPDLEAALSAATGRPVRVGDVRVQAYPEPGLVLADVDIGQGAGAIRVHELKLQPDPGTLISERWTLRRVILRGLTLQLERVGEIPLLADPGRTPKIGAILLRETDVSFSGLVLKDAEAEIQRDGRDRMQALSVRSLDRSLSVTARPVADAVILVVEGFAWRPDEASNFVADSLSFTGRLEKDRLLISGLEIRVFDGLVKGDAVVRTGATPNLTGNITFERIDATRLGEALGIERRLTGAIAGKMQYSAGAESWPAIFSSIDGDGDFTVQRGSLYGIDLAEAVRRGSPVQGGVTTFERMSGGIRLTRNSVELHDLEIVSGLMRTTGRIEVATTGATVGALSGRLDWQMMGSVNQTRQPVIVSGSLDAPTVRAAGRQ